MAVTPVFVGLDCGGSSSRTVAVDGSGAVLFQGHAGSANLASTPEKILSANLRKATDGCPEASAVCGCFAGLLTEADRHRAEEHLHRLFPKAEVRAEPDYAAALFANRPEPDVCVICGTGSIVCSRLGDQIVRSGGGGYILGDFGSAYQIGRDALSQFLFGEELPSTRLRAQVVEQFGTEEPNAVVAQVYRSAAPQPLIARFAKLVGQDAAEGIPYAVRSVEDNMAKLAELTGRHIRRTIGIRRNDDLSGASLSVVLAGGIFKGGQPFRHAFEQALANQFPKTKLMIESIKNPPVRGAVALAQEMPFGH